MPIALPWFLALRRNSPVRRLEASHKPDGALRVRDFNAYADLALDHAPNELGTLSAARMLTHRESSVNSFVDSTADGSRKQHMVLLATVPLLIIDDLGRRKLPASATEDLLEIVMRRYELASTLMMSCCPVQDWGEPLGDSAAVTAMLDRRFITGTPSSAVRAVGEPKWTCPTRRFRAKTILYRTISVGGL